MALVEMLLPQERERLATVSEDAPLINAARLLQNPETGLVVVRGADEILAGVISKSDVVRQMGRCQGASCTAPAAEVITREAISCRPGDWLNDVWSMMRERGLKNVPVTDEASRPLGVLKARDMLQSLLLEAEQEQGAMPYYVTCMGYR